MRRSSKRAQALSHAWLPLAVVIGLCAGARWLLARHGWSEESLVEFIRWSARTSAALFLVAFALSDLTVRGGRSWGQLRQAMLLGILASHGLHFVAIALRIAHFPDPFLEERSPIVPALLFGATVYGLLIWLAVQPSRELTEQRPGAVERSLEVALWCGFAFSYFPRAVQDSTFVPLALALVATLGLRVATWLRLARPR